MIWEGANDSLNRYPGVTEYAKAMKDMVMAAHDSILAARVKQTRNANRTRRPAPFEEGDLTYISSANISFPQGMESKLLPKYLGPYRINKSFGNDSFEIDLPPLLRQRGVHPVFHADKLRVHVPHEDRLFPGRDVDQLDAFEGRENEWAIDKIISHSRKGRRSLFEVRWKAGDVTWMPYEPVRELTALDSYLEACGTSSIDGLDTGRGNPPNVDPPVSVFSVDHTPERRNRYKKRHNLSSKFSPLSPSFTIHPTSLLRHIYHVHRQTLLRSYGSQRRHSTLSYFSRLCRQHCSSQLPH